MSENTKQTVADLNNINAAEAEQGLDTAGVIRVVYKRQPRSTGRKLAYAAGVVGLIGAAVGGYYLLRNGGADGVVEAVEAASEAAA